MKALDPRRERETEKRIRRTAQELKEQLRSHDRAATLIVELLALTRDLLQMQGEQAAAKRLMHICPDLSNTVARLQDLARQISATSDDLQQVLTARL